MEQKDTSDLVGCSLTHYRILDRLGQGGMGEVFLAEDLRLGRRVALKVLHPKLAADPRHLERFQKEARAVAALNHPNIVTIHSVEETECLQFLVMELVTGKTLADLLSAQGPFPLEVLLDVALALTRALEAAHGRGIVHRDLKPRNVMVSSEGRIKILDFGVARIASTDVDQEDTTDTHLTETGMIMGTAHYMAPEQILGQPVDPRTDLFSLGVLLFEMATGRRPFWGATRGAVLASILSDSPPLARSLRPGLPHRFDEILALCLAKEPFLRYKNATELRQELEGFARGDGLDLGTTLVAVRSLPKKPEGAVRWDRSPLTSSRLPASPRCLGRDKEIRELVEALCADPLFSVPVLGPAGAGKSTMTLAALHHPQVAERFGQRRFFVRCDGATDRDSLVAAIARLVCPGAQPPLEAKALLELEEAPAVLALDNFETPWEQDTAAVEELLAELAAVPGLALVVALRGGQRPFGPDWREALRAVPLDQKTARDVFLSFAGERFGDDPDLNSLLMELDGLALAVVLLASQAEGEPDLSVLKQRWQEQRTALLHRGWGREKQQSLEVSLRLSLDSPRMTKEALRLLSLLGLLPEGVARGDLAALLPGAGAEAASVLRKVGLAYDQGSRLRVLAPIREYMQRSHPPADEDFDRTVDHYLTLARIGERIGGEGGAEAADRLRAEMGNLEPMILAGLERTDPIPAIHSALAYAEAARFTGIGGLTLIGCARQAAQAGGLIKLEADCIRKRADIDLYRAHYEQAWIGYEQARMVYENIRDPHGQACCVACLGDVHLHRARPMAASRLYEEPLAFFQEVGDLRWTAHCLLGLGTAAIHRSDKSGRLRLEEALDLFRQIGDVRGEANCLKHMATGNFDLGFFDAAEAENQTALKLFRQVGSLLGQAGCILSLAHIAVRRGEARRAQDFCEEALTLNRRVGSRHGEANCLFVFANAARVLSDLEGAELLLLEARQRFQRIGEGVGEANCAFYLGEIAFARSQASQAQRWFEEALSLYREVPRPISIGRSHLSLAKLAPPDSPERLAHIEAARRAWEEAGIFDQLRSELDEVAQPTS